MTRFLKRLYHYYSYKLKYKNCQINFGVYLNNSQIGNSVSLFDDVVLYNSIIDDYSYVQSKSIILNTEIGKFCSLASNIQIGLPNHPIDRVSTSPVFYDNTQPLPFFFTNEKLFEEEINKTIIEADVWIGQNVFIKSGIKIGVGSVIAAGSIVTKDIEPYSIVAGVPAKHIKFRFKEEIRNALIKSKWWEYDEQNLINIVENMNDPQVFLNKLEEQNV